MAVLADLYITEEKLDTLLKTIRAKNEKGVSLTISINDEINDYDQNVSSFVSQSKEDREAGKKKYYVGNGRVFWTNGNEVRTAKELKEGTSNEPVAGPQGNHDDTTDDLPF